MLDIFKNAWPLQECCFMVSVSLYLFFSIWCSLQIIISCQKFYILQRIPESNLIDSFRSNKTSVYVPDLECFLYYLSLCLKFCFVSIWGISKPLSVARRARCQFDISLSLSNLVSDYRNSSKPYSVNRSDQ